MSIFSGVLLRYFSRSHDHPGLPDEKSCVVLRYPSFSCHACRDTCPVGAIGNDLKKNQSICRDCGLCAVSCPSSARRSDNDIYALWQIMRRNRNKEDILHFCCHRTEGEMYPSTIRVHCLVSLELPLMLLPALLNYGDVWLHQGLCAECPLEDAQRLDARLAYQSSRAEKLLAAAGLSLRLTLSPKPPQVFAKRRGQNTDYSRRDFLTLLRQETKQTARGGLAFVSDLFLNEEEDNKGITRIQIWEKLLQCFPTMANGREALPFAMANVLPSCNLCRACSALCPSGALELKEDETTQSLIHYPIKCTACGVCSRFCPHNAVSLLPWEGPDWKQRVIRTVIREPEGDEIFSKYQSEGST